MRRSGENDANYRCGLRRSADFFLRLRDTGKTSFGCIQSRPTSTFLRVSLTQTERQIEKHLARIGTIMFRSILNPKETLSGHEPIIIDVRV